MQVIPLNIQEIFLWYFEQKGVDNPERFLGVNERVGVNGGVNENVVPNQPTDMFQQLTNQNPENPINQLISKILTKAEKKESDISDIIAKLKRNRKARKDN